MYQDSLSIMPTKHKENYKSSSAYKITVKLPVDWSEATILAMSQPISQAMSLITSDKL